jgi:hypothetical protein
MTPIILTFFDPGQIVQCFCQDLGCTHFAWSSYTAVQMFCTTVHLYTVHTKPGASLASVGVGDIMKASVFLYSGFTNSSNI